MHVVIRGPMDTFEITNYRTFTRAGIIDVNAAACLLRDDMPTICIIGSRKTVWPWPSLCAAMDAWSDQLAAAEQKYGTWNERAGDDTRSFIRTAYAWDVSTNEVGKRDVGEEDISVTLWPVLCGHSCGLGCNISVY